jgi:hypothetical protein
MFSSVQMNLHQKGIKLVSDTTQLIIENWYAVVFLSAYVQMWIQSACLLWFLTNKT